MLPISLEEIELEETIRSLKKRDIRNCVRFLSRKVNFDAKALIPKIEDLTKNTESLAYAVYESYHRQKKDVENLAQFQLESLQEMIELIEENDPGFIEFHPIYDSPAQKEEETYGQQQVAKYSH